MAAELPNPAMSASTFVLARGHAHYLWTEMHSSNRALVVDTLANKQQLYTPIASFTSKSVPGTESAHTAGLLTEQSLQS